MSLHIVIVTSSFPLHDRDARAAAGLFVRDFALAVHEIGHDVTVVTPDKACGDRPKEDPPGVDVIWFPWLGGRKVLGEMRPWRPLDAIAMLSLFRHGRRRLDQLVRERRVDHVLAMWAVPAGLLACGLKRRHGIPFSTWCLGSDVWTYGRYPVVRSLLRSVLTATDHLYADGFELTARVTELCGRPCRFLPSSRRLDRTLVPDPPREPNGGHRFLFVGRYHAVKGVDVLLEAFARYLDTDDGKLVLLGGGPLEAEVLKRASRPDLASSVTVGGFADEATVVREMAACDTVVIPSRMESIPVVLSDALQMQRPVIVSDVGSMGRVVSESGCGLVVPPDDPTRLAEALRERAADDVDRFAAGVAALAARFDTRSTAAEWLGHVSLAEAGSVANRGSVAEGGSA